MYREISKYIFFAFIGITVQTMIVLFYILKINLITDIRYQSRSVFFLYLMSLFVVLVKVHSCTHTYIQHFNRKLMGYFLFINSITERDVTVDGGIKLFAVSSGFIKLDFMFYFFPHLQECSGRRLEKRYVR